MIKKKTTRIVLYSFLLLISILENILRLIFNYFTTGKNKLFISFNSDFYFNISLLIIVFSIYSLSSSTKQYFTEGYVKLYHFVFSLILGCLLTNFFYLFNGEFILLKLIQLSYYLISFIVMIIDIKICYCQHYLIDPIKTIVVSSVVIISIAICKTAYLIVFPKYDDYYSFFYGHVLYFIMRGVFSCIAYLFFYHYFKCLKHSCDDIFSELNFSGIKSKDKKIRLLEGINNEIPSYPGSFIIKGGKISKKIVSGNGSNSKPNTNINTNCDYDSSDDCNNNESVVSIHSEPGEVD